MCFLSLILPPFLLLQQHPMHKTRHPWRKPNRPLRWFLPQEEENQACLWRLLRVNPTRKINLQLTLVLLPQDRPIELDLSPGLETSHLVDPRSRHPAREVSS